MRGAGFIVGAFMVSVPIMNIAGSNQRVSINLSKEDPAPIENLITIDKKTDIKTGYADEEKVLPKKKVVSSCPKPSKDSSDYFYHNVGQTVAIPNLYYVPKDLMELPKNISLSHICLQKDAEVELEKMIADAKLAGFEIKVTSGFRDHDTQSEILKRWIAIRGNEAYSRIAKPGYSEHQLGLAVDVSGASIGYTSAAKKFGNSKEVEWLLKNSPNYGFIMSYPEGKEDITNYNYEPWHYRYIGIEDAQRIAESNLTITEYLVQKMEENSNIGG